MISPLHACIRHSDSQQFEGSPSTFNLRARLRGVDGSESALESATDAFAVITRTVKTKGMLEKAIIFSRKQGEFFCLVWMVFGENLCGIYIVGRVLVTADVWGDEEGGNNYAVVT